MCFSGEGGGELGIATAVGLGPTDVLLSAIARAAVNSGLTNEKNYLPAMRCLQELLLHLITGPALVLPRMKMFWLLHLGQTRIERPKSNAFW